MPEGLIICFEGINGSGKSLLMKAFSEYLDEVQGIIPVTLKSFNLKKLPLSSILPSLQIENSDENMGLLSLANELSVQALALEHRSQMRVVLQDRGPLSAYIYNSLTLNCKSEGYQDLIQGVSYSFYTNLPNKPDITFFIDAPPQVCLSRVLKRGNIQNKFFNITDQSLTSLRNAYLNVPNLFPKSSDSYFIVDNSSTDIDIALRKVIEIFKRRYISK